MFEMMQSLVAFDGSIGSLVQPMIVILFVIGAVALRAALKR